MKKIKFHKIGKSRNGWRGGIALSAPFAIKEIDYIAIGLTNYCHLNCSFCFMSADDNKRNSISLNIDAIRRTLNFAKSYNVKTLAIGGGEPFFEFDSILEIIKTAEVSEIIVFTSGFFAITEERAEKYFNKIKSAQSERNTYKLNPISIYIYLSIDDFHGKVNELNILNMIFLFDKYYASGVPNLHLVLKGILTPNDPIPKILTLVNATEKDNTAINFEGKCAVYLPSGLRLDLVYSEVKIQGFAKNSGLENENFVRGFEKNLNGDEPFIEGNEVHLSVSFNGDISIHEYLASDLIIGNVYETNFEYHVIRRLTYDPLIVAIRKFSMKNMFLKIINEYPLIANEAIKANNRFVIISRIFENSKLLKEVYEDLALRLNTNSIILPYFSALAHPHVINSLDRVLIELTTYCPVQCSFCWMEAAPNKNSAKVLTQEEIDKVIDLVNSHNVLTLDITGGEALSEIDLVTYIIRVANVKRISISTSGYFANSASSVEVIIEKIIESNKKRAIEKGCSVPIDFHLSVDEFHWHVSKNVLGFIIDKFENLHNEKYEFLLLDIRAMQTLNDPLKPYLMKRGAVLKRHKNTCDIPLVRAEFSSGFGFDIKYQEVRITDSQFNRNYSPEVGYYRTAARRSMDSSLYVGRGEHNGAYLFINSRGDISLHAFLSDKFPMTNIHKDNFKMELEHRLTYDPLIVGLRELGLKVVRDIAYELKPEFDEKAILSNNIFMIVSEIIADKELSEYTNRRLIEILDN